MTLPESIKVGTLTYRVLTDVAAIKAASDEADVEGEWAAFSNHDALVIGINPNHAPDAQWRDLLHEVLHCCLGGVWVNQYATIVSRAKQKHGGYGVEEFVVTALTLPLLGVLRDNPELLAGL